MNRSVRTPTRTIVALSAFVAVTLSCASSDPGKLTGAGAAGVSTPIAYTIDFVDCP